MNFDIVDLNDETIKKLDAYIKSISIGEFLDLLELAQRLVGEDIPPKGFEPKRVIQIENLIEEGFSFFAELDEDLWFTDIIEAAEDVRDKKREKKRSAPATKTSSNDSWWKSDDDYDPYKPYTGKGYTPKSTTTYGSKKKAPPPKKYKHDVDIDSLIDGHVEEADEKDSFLDQALKKLEKEVDD